MRLSKQTFVKGLSILFVVCLGVAFYMNFALIMFCSFTDDEIVRYEQSKNPSMVLRVVKSRWLPHGIREKALHSLHHMNDSLNLNLSLGNAEISNLKATFPEMGEESFDVFYEPFVDGRINPVLNSLIANNTITESRRCVAFIVLVQKSVARSRVENGQIEQLWDNLDEALRLRLSSVVGKLQSGGFVSKDLRLNHDDASKSLPKPQSSNPSSSVQ